MTALTLRFMPVLLLALSMSSIQSAQLFAGKKSKAAQIAPIADSSSGPRGDFSSSPTLPANVQDSKSPAEPKRLEQESKVAAHEAVVATAQNGHPAHAKAENHETVQTKTAHGQLTTDSSPAQTSTSSQPITVSTMGSSTEQVVGISLFGMVKDAVWSKMPWVTSEAYLTHHAKSATLPLVLPQDMQRQNTFNSAINEVAEKMTTNRERDYILRLVRIMSEGHKSRIPMSDTAKKVALGKLQERLALAQMGITLLNGWDTIPADKTPVPETVFIKPEADVANGQGRPSPSKSANGHTDHKENGANGTTQPAQQQPPSASQGSNA